ncbi:glycosyltransferase family 4 protein [Acinetobacter sp. ANC 4636]
MKTILITTDQIYLHGGIEKVMSTKVNYWVNQPDVEVCILTTEQNDLPPRYSLDNRVKLIDLGVNYNRKKSYLSIENIVKAIQHFIKQKKAIRKLKPNAIISPNYSFDHFWLPFIKGNAVLIKERHSSGYQAFKQQIKLSFLTHIKSMFNNWISAKYDYIVVLNEDEKQYISSNNVVVIPNPIELSELVANQNAKKIIAAGRLSPIKGFNKLIDAWALIHAARQDWQLHIYGENYLETKQRLQHQIDVLGLQSCVELRDSVPNIPIVMTDYSLYTMTSESECFPMVLLEALSVGLPIVSFDCPNGPRNIIKNREDGILVPLDNIKELASTILSLMDNLPMRISMGINAKQNIKRFSTTTVMQQWDVLLGLK